MQQELQPGWTQTDPPNNGFYGGYVVSGSIYTGLSYGDYYPTPVPSTLVMSSILFCILGVVWSYKRFKHTTEAV